jgi:hypothetical protein
MNTALHTIYDTSDCSTPGGVGGGEWRLLPRVCDREYSYVESPKIPAGHGTRGYCLFDPLGSSCAKGGRFPRVCDRDKSTSKAQRPQPVTAPGVTVCSTPWGRGVARVLGSPGFVTGIKLHEGPCDTSRSRHPGLLVVRPLGVVKTMC